MIKFPLIEIIKDRFCKHWERPDDYLPERWEFMKKYNIGQLIIGTGIGLLLIGYLEGEQLAVAVVSLIIIVLGMDMVTNKEKKRKWLHGWWRGEHPKWSILWKVTY